MTLTRKILASLMVLTVVGSLSGAATFSAFSSKTERLGNTFAAGTVSISDNDLNGAMFSLTGLKPGTVIERCLKVTYAGNLNAEVRLHTDSTIGAVGQYLDLTITPGTQSNPSYSSCTNFAPDAGGALFNGTLAGFASTHSSWAQGLADQGPGSANTWAEGDAVVYRFAVSVQDNDAARNSSTGLHRFLVEARNE